MKLIIDEEADALYLRLDDSVIIDTKEAEAGVMLDFNEKDQVVGVEILKLSERSSKIDLNKLLIETRQKTLTV